MIGKYGSFIVIFLLVVLACPPVLASEVGEYELVATWGSLGADDGRFNNPTGIAVDGEGNVYVADTRNDRIQKFDSTGAFLLKWGSEGSGDGEFYSPQDIALDADGNVYVVDSSRIQVFDSNGTFIRKWGSYGTGEEQLQSPRSIAFDADNNAYVIAGGGIKKFDSDGSFRTAWGALGTYDGEFNNPTDVAVDGAGNVYVADCYNDRIQKFNSNGGFLLKWGGGTGDVYFQSPYGITVDSAGDVLVASFAPPILKFDSSGNLLARYTGGSSNMGIATGADGTVYVTSDHCVRVFKQSSAPTPTPTVPKAPSITSNKDIVVCGNSFVVTITGELSKDYHLFIKEIDDLGPDQYPEITPGQVGVYYNAYTDNPTRNVSVMTNAAGTRSVQFDTNQSTKAATYTIRVEDPDDRDNKYDEVRVRVEEGDVTITPSGTGVYPLGDEITFSGTCTESDKVCLFMTGPNLAAGGVNLTDLGRVVDNEEETFTVVPVKADDTWSYKWDTANLGRSLDPGDYTIYAVSAPRDRNHLSDVKYATTSLQLRSPSLTVGSSGTSLTPGDDYRISGTATGVDSVQIWIFGKNYYRLGVPVAVGGDNSFEYVLTGTETAGLSKGQYYVVVQHPMMNRVFNIDAGTGAMDGWIVGTPDSGFPGVRIAGLQASDAATALINALDSPNIDDTYIKLSFSIDISRIWIDAVSDQTYGEIFTVTGTTDYPAGTVLTYRITEREGGTTVLTDEAVVTGDGDWGFAVDTTVIGPGAFTLLVTAPDGQASATMLFDIYDDVTHPVPPGGGSYRVERIGVTPALDSLSPGKAVALDGIIKLDDAIGSPRPWIGYGYLEFSTNLADPMWSYGIETGGQEFSTGSTTINSRSFTLSGWELDYNWGEVRIFLSLSGKVPDVADGQDSVLLRIVQRDSGGRAIPNSGYHILIPLGGDDPAPPPNASLTLRTGWNFISVPRPLAAGNDTATIFAAVDTDSHSAFRYDTANRNWIALQETDQIRPLEGYWIYSTGPATVPLTFSTDPLVSPPERSLSTGWNAIGITGTAPATARDALKSVNKQWATLIGYDSAKQRFETGIVNGGTGANADTRPVYPGRGYWLSMTGPGTLYAIGA